MTHHGEDAPRQFVLHVAFALVFQFVERCRVQGEGVVARSGIRLSKHFGVDLGEEIFDFVLVSNPNATDLFKFFVPNQFDAMQMFWKLGMVVDGMLRFQEFSEQFRSSGLGVRSWGQLDFVSPILVDFAFFF